MNIYIGNLPLNVSETEVTNLFTRFGEVSSVRIIMEQGGIQSRGFGFVTMDNQEAGYKAMQALDNTKYKTRNLEVSEATSG